MLAIDEFYHGLADKDSSKLGNLLHSIMTKYYYVQLNGYNYLKALGIGYHFINGNI